MHGCNISSAVQMAVVRYGPDGAPTSCQPYGTVATSYARYSRGPGVFSVGVVFRRGDNVQSTAILNISCVSGGPTSFFRYTVQELSKGTIILHTTVACSSPVLGPGPLFQGYWCADDSTCLYGPKPSKLYKGTGNQKDCEDICHPQLYECKGGRCVESSTGIPLRGCLEVCPAGPEPAPVGYVNVAPFLLAYSNARVNIRTHLHAEFTLACLNQLQPATGGCMKCWSVICRDPTSILRELFTRCHQIHATPGTGALMGPVCTDHGQGPTFLEEPNQSARLRVFRGDTCACAATALSRLLVARSTTVSALAIHPWTRCGSSDKNAMRLLNLCAVCRPLTHQAPALASSQTRSNTRSRTNACTPVHFQLTWDRQVVLQCSLARLDEDILRSSSVACKMTFFIFIHNTRTACCA